MTNNTKIILAVLLVIIVGGLLYFSRGSNPNDEPTPQAASIAGCYVATLAKDVYTLNIKSQVGDAVTGTLAFKNFQKDSSSGTFEGTYKDDILLGDYSFTSEGTDSVMQVIFKKSGNTFVRGYGDMNATGDRFADLTKITFDPNQTFIASATCL